MHRDPGRVIWGTKIEDANDHCTFKILDLFIFIATFRLNMRVNFTLSVQQNDTLKCRQITTIRDILLNVKCDTIQIVEHSFTNNYSICSGKPVYEQTQV